MGQVPSFVAGAVTGALGGAALGLALEHWREDYVPSIKRDGIGR
jgi:hypothetical protein